MKHTLKVTIILVLLFFFSQVTGLYIIDSYIDYNETVKKGETVSNDIMIGNQIVERPPEKGIVGYIFAAIIIGTILLLFLIKLKAVRIWKFWFFLSVWFLLSIALAPFITKKFAWIIALILALWKVIKPNPIIHNITEVFVYGGLAAIFVPLKNFKPWHAMILLLIISIYDMIAVWKIKHMITLAKFQTKTRVFAGLFVPYQRVKEKKVKLSKLKKPRKVVHVKRKVTNAILGGGDIGFPLVFSGVVMKELMYSNPEWLSFFKAVIISFFVSIALLMLFLKSKKDKFYPAMPFLTIGCLVGYCIVLLF